MFGLSILNPAVRTQLIHGSLIRSLEEGLEINALLFDFLITCATCYGAIYVFAEAWSYALIQTDDQLQPKSMLLFPTYSVL
jgi:hypothetical protein